MVKRKAVKADKADKVDAAQGEEGEEAVPKRKQRKTVKSGKVSREAPVEAAPAPAAAEADEADDAEEGEGEESEDGEEARQAALEAKFAAFGEAFMGSIDAPPLKPMQRPEVVAKAASALVEKAKAHAANQEKLPGTKKQRKKERRLQEEAAEAQKTAVGAVIGAPASATAGAPKEREKKRDDDMTDILGLIAGISDKKAQSAAAIAPSKPASVASERKRFMGGKVSNIFEAPKKKKKTGNEDDLENTAEFKQTLKEVLAWVNPQLDRRDKKIWEDQKIRALGGTPDKRPKINFKSMQERAKKHQGERAVAVESDKQLGVETSFSGHRQSYEVDKLMKKKKEDAKRRKNMNEDRKVWALGMNAREHRGLVTIPNSQIKKFNFQRKFKK